MTSTKEATTAKLISFQGKEIYYVDYSDHTNIVGMLSEIKKANAFRKEFIEKAGKKDILMLVNLTNSFVFGEVLDELKRSAKEVKDITRRKAVVGVTGGKKILLNTTNALLKTNFKAFDTEEEAKIWLVS